METGVFLGCGSVATLQLALSGMDDARAVRVGVLPGLTVSGDLAGSVGGRMVAWHGTLPHAVDRTSAG